MKPLYEEMFGESPKIIATHGGLECGIIGGHYPNMDMISFGPNITGPHSPDERVEIQSVQKVYKRSEEHTSELQSRGHLVCRLLLEKKNNKCGMTYRAA